MSAGAVQDTNGWSWAADLEPLQSLVQQVADLVNPQVRPPTRRTQNPNDKSDRDAAAALGGPASPARPPACSVT